MGAPPQLRANRAQHAERAAKIWRLKLAGLTERQIAAEVGLSQTRVNEIIAQQMTEMIGPLVGEYADHREAELQDLYTRAYRIAVDRNQADDVRLKAINQCKVLNESRRKLRGADAPESLAVTHTANIDLSADLVGEVLATVIPAIAQAAGTDQGRRAQLERFGLELAQWVLSGRQGEEPQCAPARLAITAGSPERPSDGPTEPVPPRRPHDDADGVMAALAGFEAEFGPLTGDDDEA